MIMRLFLAHIPPKEIRDIMRDDRALFKKQFKNYFAYTPIDQLHLTLKFLGSEISEESKDMLIANLQKHKSMLRQTKIEFGSLSFGFKYQSKPVVLKYGIYENQDLLELINNINSVVRKTELLDVIRYKEKVDYHITLARVNPTAPKHIRKQIYEFLDDHKSKVEGLLVNMQEIQLLSSQSTKDGTLYKPIYSQELVN